MKHKLAWRFRKGSMADPIKTLPCGCKQYVYDGTIVKHCEEHMPPRECEDSEGEAMIQRELDDY
ncbi:hypothetical protein M0R72_13390 [Candidatus Pacearchaeota archaeon]|jgi:hypothetical protein|nr:hypothetical protein [Candidatus Pacearchaeota archaeon]